MESEPDGAIENHTPAIKPEIKPAIKAVIFDIGGVLLHTLDRSALCRWEARVGLSMDSLRREVFSSPASWRASIGLATEADVWLEFACLFRLTADEVRMVADDLFAGEAVDQEVAMYVRSLRPRYKTALLSNAWPEARQSLCERRGLGDLTDTLILSAEERLMKPDTRIYELAADRLGVAPEETLFVDDYMPNVEGARDAGLRAVHYTTREATLSALSSLLS